VNNDHVDSADMPRNARATLDAWRECGADRLDPLRFHFIVALERRAAAHGGDVRRVLDKRVAKLIHAYSADVERAALHAKPAVCLAAPADQHAGEETQSLAGLVEYLAESTHRSTAYPELAAVEYFRSVWSRVRSEKQIRQSLAPVSGNAGPLNSSSLVHRALSLMSEVSPGYLKQFLSYVDTLSWMEQMNGGAPAAKETARSGTPGRSGRGKAR
jgi:hypothetical protein